MTIPTVSLLNETDLVRLVYTANSITFDEQITVADLRKALLHGGLSINLEGNDTTPYVMIRNKLSTIIRYPEFTAQNYAGSTSGYPIFTLYNIKGSYDSPLAANGNFPLGSLIGQSHDGIDYAAGASVYFRTASAWSPSSHGTQIVFATVKDGEIGNPVERVAIEDDGRFTFNPPLVITGSRSDGTALTNLLTALASKGIIVDNTTP